MRDMCMQLRTLVGRAMHAMVSCKTPGCVGLESFCGTGQAIAQQISRRAVHGRQQRRSERSHNDDNLCANQRLRGILSVRGARAERSTV